MLSIKNAIGGGIFPARLIIFVALGIVVIIAIGLVSYFYLQQQQSQLANTKNNANHESKNLLIEVGKLIVLPSGEEPTIATVSDITKLKGQSFFVHAKNGDKVLIYAKAQKAILYDPVTQKIIEVGPINLKQATPAANPTPATLRVALYNGTETIGLTGTIEKQLKEAHPTMMVIVKEDAKKKTYKTTTIVDLIGKHASQAASLARTLHGEVGSLPVAETKPDGADLVVILGKN